MKIIYLFCFMLLASTEFATAQTTTNANTSVAPTPPPTRIRRNMEQLDPNAPTSKYDYHDNHT